MAAWDALFIEMELRLGRLDNVVVIGRPWRAVDRTKRIILRPYMISLSTMQAAVRPARDAGQHPWIVGISEREADLNDALRAMQGGYLIQVEQFHQEMGAGGRVLTHLPARVTPGVILTPSLAHDVIDLLAEAKRPAQPPGASGSVTTDYDLTALRLAAQWRLLGGVAETLRTTEDVVQMSLRSALGRLNWRIRPNGPDLRESGVPRRPSPGVLRAAAEARPEPDEWRIDVRGSVTDGS